MEVTVCSNMHCYNYAANTNNPSKPPFCEECQEKKKKESKKADS